MVGGLCCLMSSEGIPRGGGLDAGTSSFTKNSIIIIFLGALGVVLLMTCTWFNFPWARRLFGRSPPPGSADDVGGPREHTSQQGAPPRADSEEERVTLQGHALENRVHTRRRAAPRSYHLPGSHTVVRIDDMSKVPEAGPPPPTEKELRLQKEAAERVASPMLYGRSSYLQRSMSSLIGSFRFATTPRSPARSTAGCSEPNVRRMENEPFASTCSMDDIRIDKRI